MQERRRKGGPLLGFSFGREPSVEPPRFVFQFYTGIERGREEQGGRTGSVSPPVVGPEEMAITLRLRKRAEELKKRARTAEERSLIDLLFYRMINQGVKRVRSGEPLVDVLADYERSAGVVEAFFESAWEAGATVERTRDWRCPAVYTVEADGKCSRAKLCDRGQAIFDVKRESTPGPCTGEREDESVEAVVEEYLSELSRIFSGLERDAPSSEDVRNVRRLRWEFEEYASRIRHAETVEEAEEEKRYLLERLTGNIAPALRTAWSRGARLEASTGRCRYRTTKFRRPDGSSVYYELCPDREGVLEAVLRLAEGEARGEQPPIGIQPIQPPERAPKPPVPGPQPPKPRPPIEIQPIQPPGKAERRREVCAVSRGQRVCVDSGAGVFSVDGVEYTVVDRAAGASFGANEVVYAGGRIVRVKPYAPPFGEKRQCPSDYAVVFLVGGKPVLPDSVYTLDGRSCHAVLGLRSGERFEVWLGRLARPTPPVRII